MVLRKKTYLFIFIALILLISLFFLKIQEHMRDFEVNYTAGKRLRAGETVYQIEDGHYMFKYLPCAALFYLPLSFLPLGLAKFLWYSLVIFSLYFLVYTSYRILPSKAEKPKYLLVFTPLILTKFFLREIQLGQINAVVGMVLLFMIWFLISEKGARPPRNELYAGILWGLALSLKPHSLIFLPYFLIKKKWKSLLSGLSFLALTLWISSFFYGLQGFISVLKDWGTTLSRTTPGLFSSQDNISLAALFMKWTGDRNLALILAGVTVFLLALLMLALVLRGRGMERAPVLECSILLILIPLVSPLGWDYTLLISALGVMIVLQNFFKFTKFWRSVLIVNFCIIALSLFDILGRELYARFMSWSVITINFLFLIGYLSFLRFRKLN
jgi:alpha-1,2-mannosyltransferase